MSEWKMSSSVLFFDLLRPRLSVPHLWLLAQLSLVSLTWYYFTISLLSLSLSPLPALFSTSLHFCSWIVFRSISLNSPSSPLHHHHHLLPGGCVRHQPSGATSAWPSANADSWQREKGRKIYNWGARAGEKRGAARGGRRSITILTSQKSQYHLSDCAQCKVALEINKSAPENNIK